MDIQTRKIQFIQKFLQLQNEKLISEFEKLLEEKIELDLNGYLRPFTVEELNKRIDQSEEDFENGRFKTTEEILAKY